MDQKTTKEPQQGFDRPDHDLRGADDQYAQGAVVDDTADQLAHKKVSTNLSGVDGKDKQKRDDGAHHPIKDILKKNKHLARSESDPYGPENIV